MEAFKQFMGFLLMATVIFLLYVFGALVGHDGIFELLFGLLVGSVVAWAYGGWQRGSISRWMARLLVLPLFLIGLGLGVDASVGPVTSNEHKAETSNGYLPWSQDAVKKALADGKPVFVDFTAAWCLSCKVNERVALDTDAVQKAFADKGVVLFKADWTHSDPEISKALQQYNRDGVPLYLLYSPKQPDQPQILPEVLTPGIVLDALNKL
jgi:thiol:disulfide interchange protein DsbD